MPVDMREGIFEKYDFAHLAREKLRIKNPDFRIYIAGIKPEPPKDWTHMVVTGAVFREPTKGPNIGKLSIMVPGTQKTAKISRQEIEEYREKVSQAKPL